MKRIRVFVALEVPDEVLHSGQKIINQLKKMGTTANWVEPENVHLTLNFLGDVNETDIHEICTDVIATVRAMPAFEWTCQGVGAFPDADRPRTVWLGAGDGVDQIVELQNELAESLDEIGYRKENRRFTPHVTLGRVQGSWTAEMTQFIKDRQDFEAGRCAVEQVVVFSSNLTKSGPIYEVLSRAPLAKN